MEMHFHNSKNLVIFSEELKKGILNNLSFSPFGYLEVIDQSKKSVFGYEIILNERIDEVIVSASFNSSDRDIVVFWVNVGEEFFSLGSFMPYNSRSFQRISDIADVDIDILRLKKVYNKILCGITFYNNSGNKNRLKLVNVVLTDRSKTPIYKKIALSNDIILDIPKISQMTQQVNYNKDICSPTSLAMVLNYYGIDVDTITVARSVYDNNAKIYGNWLFNTAYVSYLGLYSFVVRINSYYKLYKILSCGVPIIASIKFGENELKNSPLKSTSGHLVVIKGITKYGDVVVNDPAGLDDNDVERIYDGREFFNAWIVNKCGTGYIVADENRIKNIVDIFRSMEEI